MDFEMMNGRIKIQEYSFRNQKEGRFMCLRWDYDGMLTQKLLSSNRICWVEIQNRNNHKYQLVAFFLIFKVNQDKKVHLLQERSDRIILVIQILSTYHLSYHPPESNLKFFSVHFTLEYYYHFSISQIHTKKLLCFIRTNQLSLKKQTQKSKNYQKSNYSTIKLNSFHLEFTYFLQIQLLFYVSDQYFIQSFNQHNQGIIMFEDRKIICAEGHQSSLICVTEDCPAKTSFVCSRNCGCFRCHRPTCSLKNITELSNGVETLLKRNFHKGFKGEGIEVVARIARQTIPAPKNTRFCLTYCQANSKHDMQFKIKSLQTCVGVGVLHKPTIIKHNYQFIPDLKDINHGGYMLLTNGYLYSHSDADQNFEQVSSFNFNEGSTFKLYILSNQLYFEQRGKIAKLNLPPDLIHDLYYGVYLYDKGDQIQVLAKE